MQSDKSSYGRSTMMSVVVFTVLLAASSAMFSCGSVRSTVTKPVASASITTSGDADAVSLQSVFQNIASKLAPMKTYAISPPEGFSLADKWWPVAEVSGPEEYFGASIENPKIDVRKSGMGSAEVVFEGASGWLEVLDNYRGDLGDIQGKSVGKVKGHAASLYQVGGALVVLWNESGMWYAVVGRGVTQDELVAVSLAATEVSAARK